MKDEAKIVRALNRMGITMFGKRLNDPEGEGRISYDIHPYTKQGSGISATVIAIDKSTGKLYILCAKKKNQTTYEQIGGYTRGQGPDGSEIQYDKRTNDERDRLEEALIGNIDAITITNEEPAPTYSQAYTLEQLAEGSMAEFLEQQKEKLGTKINPIKVKESLARKGINYPHDYNAWDTALRELKEETGLNLQSIKPHELYTSDDFGITNRKELHTKVTHYLFYLGKLDAMPAIRPGSDIGEVSWNAVDQISLETHRLNGCEVRKSYLLQTLPRAINKVRKLELKEASSFTSYSNINEKMHPNPYSVEAHLHHQAVIKKAIFLRNVLNQEISDYDSHVQPSVNVSNK